jgi:hypothetical protein
MWTPSDSRSLESACHEEARPTDGVIDAVVSVWGSLFHAAAEAVYREHGAALCAGEGTREECYERADRIVDRVFDAFLERYPLVGERVRATNRDRLRADVRELIEGDWAARQFVAVERTFGRPEPVRLVLGPRPLFLRGRIDRLDREAGRGLVRDLKTGRAHPRTGKDTGPDHRRDVQIAAYGLLAQAMARPWGHPGANRGGLLVLRPPRRGGARLPQGLRHQSGPGGARVAGPRRRPSRRAELPADARGHGLRALPVPPVCGPGAPARAAQVLADCPGTLGEFRALKRPPPRVPKTRMMLE